MQDLRLDPISDFAPLEENALNGEEIARPETTYFKDVWRSLKKRKTAVISLVILVLLVLMVLFPALIPTQLELLQRMIPQTMMTLMAGAFVIGVFWFRISDGDNPFTKGIPVPLARSVFSTYIMLLVLFIYFLPAANQFRPEKRTIQSMAKILKEANVPKDDVYFFDRDFTNAVLYLNLGYKIPVLKNDADLEKLIKDKPEKRLFIISQERFFKRISPKILKRMPFVISEYVYPWERRRKSSVGKKYSMRVLNTSSKKK